MKILAALLVISLLVIIHEFGHYIVARAFGMRVLTFSIGFGPALVRWRPKGSETVFQIAAIPVLAYVQIAGMNPREQSDPNDRGSYQNAKPLARFLTIAAGPLANFLAAGLAFFLVAALGGEPVAPTHPIVGQVQSPSALAAGLRPGDVVREINGQPVHTWDEMRRAIAESQRRPFEVQYDPEGLIRSVNGTPVRGWSEALEVLERETRPRPLRMVVEREGRRVSIEVTPKMDAESGQVRVGFGARTSYRPVGFVRSLEYAIVSPTLTTGEILRRLGEIFQHREDIQLMGPVGMVTATVQEVEKGWRDTAFSVAAISLQLFIFNLLPIPALDGGRLLVLGYEMTTHRRPNPKVEARVLAYSLMLMLGLFLVVTSREIWGLITGLISRSRG